MIRRNTPYLALGALLALVSQANAGTSAVTPALAACSKALVASLAGTDDPLPAYVVKSPSSTFADHLDPNAFTVIARNSKTNQLLGKASCKATASGEIVSFRTLKIS
jgi:hypothetical protein